MSEIQKSMNYKIGVIVPVYKVEKYIEECIESILAQTYSNFRLILVDDGTPDNAGKICDEYAQKDPRITVIHQKNAGVTQARARGVEEAKDCEFITFVDSDDTLPVQSLEILTEKIDDQTDILVGEHQEFHDSAELHLSKSEYISKLIYKGVPQAPWGKIIRKELFTEGIFDIPQHIITGEDAIMNIRLASNAKRGIIYTRQKIYNYRVHHDSAFHTFKNSLTYQNEYFNILEQAIPTDLYDAVLPQLLLRAIINWRDFYLYSSKIVRNEDQPFIQRLKRYVKESNYKLNIFDWIQLYCPYMIIRYVFVNIHKLKNTLSKR